MGKRVILLCLLLSLAVAASTAACTVFYATDGDACLGGNNEDWSDPDTYMWFVPGDGQGRLGVVYFGFGNFFPQGGMNEAGLFFDATATPYKRMANPSGKPAPGPGLVDEIMQGCATVEEALAVMDKYDPSFCAQAQFLLGDAEGGSAVVEGDKILRREQPYQILTNFRQSEYTQGSYPCWRFNTALSIFMAADRYDVGLCRRILAATHQEGGYPTQYSNVYDLRRRLIYLYHRHDFEHVLTFDLREELKKGAHRYRLAELFRSPSVGMEAGVSFVWANW